jgi:hypothetical protein
VAIQVIGSHRRRTALWLAPAVALLMVGSAVKASAITAPPPKDCNTPNASNGIGVLEQPQSINPSNQQPFLTKTLTNTVTQSGSTTYQFTLSTTRNTANDSGSGAAVTYTANSLTDTSKTWTANQWAFASVSANAGAETGTVASNTSNTLTLAANWTGGTPAAGAPYVISFFSELLDCAWDVTSGGNATTANYATQENTPTFTSGGLLDVALDVNNSDAICDRVELKGSNPNGVPFTDYSNLVGSPSGTTCTIPTAVTPDVPTPVLVVVAGAGVVGAFLLIRRRRSRGIPVS